ncbi:MAG: cupin domain-containing protein [Gemmatimonadaceae bacterium]|nr:cupin domain-containing protein [Gemmatimonadaceae bacterium]
MSRALDLERPARDCDVLAPDGSEIRLLARGRRGSMVHCTLNPGQVSLPVAHRSVEELWYVLEGAGQVWRRLGGEERIVDLSPGTSLSIPAGAHFQFRTVGERPLRIAIVTMPPWPGAEEAYPVEGCWPAGSSGPAGAGSSSPGG